MSQLFLLKNSVDPKHVGKGFPQLEIKKGIYYYVNPIDYLEQPLPANSLL